MRRWVRSVQAQLFLWGVLPVTSVVIAVAFTGVYAHQRAMRDFVAKRNFALARMTAWTIEDGVAHGLIAADGRGLEGWMSSVAGSPSETAVVMVVDEEGRAVAHSWPEMVGRNLLGDSAVAEGLWRHRTGEAGAAVVVVSGEEGPVLVAFAPVGGTDWVVIVREPVEGLIGPILRFSRLMPAVAAGAGLVSLLVLSFGWRTIVLPLQKLVRATGEVSWGDSSAIYQPVGGVQEVADLHRALTEMVERIRSYEVGMRDYVGAVTRGQEAERARLARELHDGSVQELIALAQRTEMVQRLLERGETERAQMLLEELRRAERDTVEELRRLVGALRPIYLEDLGLIPALETLVQQVAKRTTARLRLEAASGVHQCRFAPEVELAAYRIAQEALNNAILHSHADNIVVSVECDLEGLTLSLTDDGVGFTLPSRPDSLTQAGRFGLVGMRERAILLGGTFRIRTAPGEGTETTVHLPNQSPMD